MIIRGKFSHLSVAIYGDIATEAAPSTSTYEPKELPHVERNALPPSLDPSNTIDPTALAQSILSLAPDSPSLSLLIRLMFCLKPSNEDWDEPGFPHLYANFDQDLNDMSLERAVELTSRPVSDFADEGTLTRFASGVGLAVDNKVCSAHTFWMSKQILTYLPIE